MRYTTLVVLLVTCLYTTAQQADSTATFNVKKNQGLYFPCITIPEGYTLVACKLIIATGGELVQKYCTWNDVPGAVNFFWQNARERQKVYFEEIVLMKDGVKFKSPPQSAVFRYQ